jgi:transposase
MMPCPATRSNRQIYGVRKVLKLAHHDVQVRKFMTAPGLGPITALCFKATINDPTRFKRSRSVCAYVG